MFNVGDYVIYGSKGVCRVEKIGKSPTGSDNRLYYTLAPEYIKGSTVFTPVDNTKVVLRGLISKEEAEKLVGDIPSIESLWVESDKERENEFKNILARCIPREIIKMIKNIYQRKIERLAEGKKVTVSDERYFKMAEDSLYGELAISLGMDREKVKEFISERLETEEMIPVG